MKAELLQTETVINPLLASERKSPDEEMEVFQILSEDESLLTQLYPYKLGGLYSFLGDVLSRPTESDSEIPPQFNSVTATAECSYCQYEKSIVGRIPVTVNMQRQRFTSEHEVHQRSSPILQGANGSIRANLCEGCATELFEQVESILNQRPELLLAGKI